jgi:ATP-binding cassette subfamily B multidrug efflux pump
MLKLIRYLKPFYWFVILIFALLFGQALCDLALPDYMSKIINIGIQQNGIESAVPDAIRAGEMNKLFLFMDQGDKDIILQNYLLPDKQQLSKEQYQKYLESYPILASEPVYVLNTGDKPTIDRLNTILGRPILIVYTIEKSGLPQMPGISENIPENADPFAILGQVPASQMEAIRQTARQQLASLPDSVISQSAISYLSVEYKAIGIDLGSKQTRYLFRIGGLMLLLTLAGTLASICVGFLSARIAAGFARITRRKVFDKVEHFSNKEFDKFSTASLITRTTNDIQQIQMVLVILLRIVFYAPIIGIGGIIKALGQDMSMSWIIGASVLTLLSMIVVIFAIAISRFRKIQLLVNTQDQEEKKFDKANVDLTRINLFINRIMVFMMPAMMLIMNGAMLLVIWFGAMQVDQGSMQVGNMMAFMQYTVQIIMAFLMVSMIFIMVPRASVSAKSWRLSQV